MTDLIDREAAIGILAHPGDSKCADAASAQAAEAGVPILGIDDKCAGGTTFQILHSTEARATELARRALTLGARSFAVLTPDSTAGNRLGDAFRAAVLAGGGEVTVNASYIAGATSFGSAIAPLRKARFDAVFVPDTSDRLELLAPALAAADLWAQPWGATRSPNAKTKARPVLLLSTASFLSQKLLRNAGRYVQGALLAPGFYAAEDDTRSGPFVRAHRDSFGKDPGVTEAYAHDGVRILRLAIERGARTRAETLSLLGTATFAGVTGDVRFGPDHGRADPPLVYVVNGDEIQALSARPERR